MGNQSSDKRRKSEGSVEDREDDDPFNFLSGDDDPTRNMPIKQRLRAEKAIKHTVAALASKSATVAKEKKSCSDYLSFCCDDQYNEVKEKVGASPTELTPEMQRASQQGWKMIKTIMFPALPAIVQDLWVYLELLISVVAFVLGLLDTFPVENTHAYNYSYLVLATISMILALIDGFIYFFQLGSCARCIHDCRGNSAEHQPLEQQGDESEESQRKCCRLTENQKEAFNTWFEFCRNLLSELLLYPLIMFDLFDFIIGQGYIPEGARGRADFSLFVIGGFYLILSVYIMRILIVAGSMLSLTRLPSNKEATGHKSDTFILVRFCAHILCQIVVHLMIILVIATKINNENSIVIENGSKNMTVEDNSIKASPFLITAIVLGWIIPLAGVFGFFVINYYWMKEFSIGFWLNMISLLQGESFAETVFGGQGLSAAEEKALGFVKDSQYKQVKKQLLHFKSIPVWIKFFYPARIPITAITGLLYDILLFVFIACLMLTYENGSVRFVVFTDDNKMTSMFVVSIIIIILANIHALILLNIILLMVIVIFALAAAMAIFLSPLLLLVYFPIIACLGFNLVFLDTRDLLKHKVKRESETSNSTRELSIGSDFATRLEMNTLETKA